MGRRLEAEKAGKTFYMSDKPCKHGHLEPRRVDNSQCSECARLLSEKARRKKGVKPRTKPLIRKETIYNEPVITQEEKDAVDFDDMVERIERIRGW